MRGPQSASQPGSRAFALVLVLMFAPIAATAHHSIAGQFDMNRTLNLKGVVSKVEWVNPHVYMYLDTRDERGAPVVWKLESLPVAMLRKAGIKKQMLVTGETVEMVISPARDGTSHLGFLLNVKFPDGRRFQFSRDPNAPATASR